MKRVQTRESYAKRIQRIAAFIADHLDEEINLDRLSGEACLSPYHFHRVYASVMSETLGDTVRRLRLHRAAVELIGSQKPIGEVGRRAGYGSAAAFTRAFAAPYGAPPAAYRRGGLMRSPDRISQMMETAMYDVKIEKTPPVRLAAMDHRGDYNEIGKTFDSLFAWAGARGLLGPQTRSFGVYYDDPGSVPARDLRSVAGLLVGPDFVADDAVRIVELPAMEVASLTHKGPYAELKGAYDYLYRVWLPASGREPAASPCFEEYLNNPRTLPPTEWLTRVSMPLATA